MMEMVLAMPFIFLVLALLLFLGWGMERMHRAAVVDRYDAWRAAAKAPGPSREGPRTSTGQLNSTFFADGARELVDTPPKQIKFTVQRQWRNTISSADTEAGQFADRVNENLSKVQAARFKTVHTSTIPIWNKIGGEKAIDHQHVRLGHDWRFTNHVVEDDGPQTMRWFDPGADRWFRLRTHSREGRFVPTLLRTRAMKDTYFQGLDQQVRPVARSGNGLGRMVRSLYMARPRYRGPKVPEDWIENYNRNQQLQNAPGG